jgi:hypothetical protein
MKKLGLLFTLCIIVPAMSIAQQAGAQIKFEKEVHDYGTIVQNADGGTAFVFTNTGTEPLIISDAKGSCGCTVPEWPKEPIAPGKKGSIKVQYDTNRVGAFQKTVTVTTNGSVEPIVLKIQGTVNAKEGGDGHDHSDPNHKH